jgi:hypothetical protein
MRRTFSTALLALLVFAPSLSAQQRAPIWDDASAILYETYRGIDGSGFDDYFEMLVDKYAASSGFGWGVYRENAKVGYRITALPNGLESMMEVLQARVESFQEFTDEQNELWMRGWGTRHQAVYNAAPGLSYVPDDLTVDDIRARPYNRVIIYHLKKDQVSAFQDALRRRAELDRAAGIDDLVFTVWNGGLGTHTPVVMTRNSAESLAAYEEQLAGRQAIREPYWQEFMAATRAMNDAAWHIERHDQMRIAEQSFSGGR